jgi:NAD(P)-dependent dehydrogenase (short-subunit alcohol dehydrogenase family)
MRHKPLRNQAIVITGASSGIGLTTARMAARRGARVVLAARSTDARLSSAAGKWVCQEHCKPLREKGAHRISQQAQSFVAQVRRRPSRRPKVL